MPPLPSAIDEETANTIASLERRQKDLADFQLPRLRSCTGPLSLQQQYAAEVRDDLDVFARQLEVRMLPLMTLRGEGGGARSRNRDQSE